MTKPYCGKHYLSAGPILPCVVLVLFMAIQSTTHKGKGMEIVIPCLQGAVIVRLLIRDFKENMLAGLVTVQAVIVPAQAWNQAAFGSGTWTRCSCITTG